MLTRSLRALGAGAPSGTFLVPGRVRCRYAPRAARRRPRVPTPATRGPSPRPPARGWDARRAEGARIHERRRTATQVWDAQPARPRRQARRAIPSGCPGWVAITRLAPPAARRPFSVAATAGARMGMRTVGGRRGSLICAVSGGGWRTVCRVCPHRSRQGKKLGKGARPTGWNLNLTLPIRRYWRGVMTPVAQLNAAPSSTIRSSCRPQSVKKPARTASRPEMVVGP